MKLFFKLFISCVYPLLNGLLTIVLPLDYGKRMTT